MPHIQYKTFPGNTLVFLFWQNVKYLWYVPWGQMSVWYHVGVLQMSNFRFGICKAEDVHRTSCGMICQSVQWQIPKLKFHIYKTPIWYQTLMWPNGMNHGYFTFCQKRKNYDLLEKFYIYFEILIFNQSNKKSTTGSNKIYVAVIQYKNNRCWFWLCACLPIHPLPQSHPNSL